ncbi:MAG: tryptophan 7-halogenase, partial [Polyangiaceae bacterium]|nr:tryptophan 7-halogenase [Polyangiaceae bacterium]
ERLGVTLDSGSYLYKGGAEFFDERTGDHQVYLFRDGLEGGPTHAYQVDRSKFDELLLRRSAEVGAVVHEGERVADLTTAAESALVTTDRATYRARYVVDATGQDAFMARRQRSVVPLKAFGIAAVFCHFEGLSDEANDELCKAGEGNIRILIIDDGWMWLIPLEGKRLSCGVVTRKKGAGPELLDAVIAASPMIERLTRGATRSATRTIGNFSYRNSKSRGERWVSIGDAALFLDPVFSSGVSLAMLGAERMVDALIPALAKGVESDPELMKTVSSSMESAYLSFSSLVGSFYHTKIIENLFFAKEPEPEMRAGLISILAGDIWRDDNRFQQVLLSSARQRFDP